jgi:AmmeMemoRadiSam system protein A
MAMIVPADRARLLQLARHALVARVQGMSPPLAPADLNGPTFGVFVSVHRGDDLRGCLGTVEGRERLATAVVRLAGDVAHHDHRFAPIEPDEIDHVVIDLSVLTRPEPVEDPTEIIIGRHGVIVERGLERALLLPQVAPEHGWDRETLLARTCDKAGLAIDAWKHGAAIFRFEAEVFGEK